MEHHPHPSSDQITVLVFKDHLASRTFQISLKWLTTLGLLIGFIAFFSILGSALAVKYYRIASRAHPAHAQNLENELETLKAHLKKLESTTTPAPPPPPPSSAAPMSVSQPPSLELGFPTLLFPPETQFLQSKQEELPIRIQNPEIHWNHQGLSFEFALEYVKPDHGTHQGRIVILAQGKNTLLSYPEETLEVRTQDKNSSSLIHPDAGESYSLSRYRKVSAQFGPLPNRKMIHTLEVFLFNSEGTQILFHKAYPVPTFRSSTTTPTEEPQA